MKPSSTWRTAPISCTCEVKVATNPDPETGLCNDPTDYAYPAMGSGWMALCARHAQPHLSVSGVIGVDELINRGEKFK